MADTPKFDSLYNLRNTREPINTQVPTDTTSFLSEEFMNNLKLKDKKALELQQRAQEKRAAFGDEPSSDLLNLLGSSSIQAGANLADTAITIGANIVRSGAEATGLGQYYTEQDKQIATSALDPYTTPEVADKMANYDRTGYAAGQKAVGQAVEQGNYGEALLQAAPIALETITESLPTMALLFAGGPTSVIRTAGSAAMKEASVLGASKAVQMAAKKTAEKEARAALSMTGKAKNMIAENAGLLTFATDQTRQQSEQFKANNNGTEMSTLEMSRAFAINTLLGGLDRWAFKDIIGLKKPIKDMVKSIPKSATGIVANKILMTAKGMGEEAGQEYLQQWGEILNENWGTEKAKTLTEAFTKTNNDEAVVAAILGGVAGGTTAQVGNAANTIGELNQLGKAKKDTQNLDKTLEAGYADEKTKEKFGTNIDKSVETYTTRKQDLENVQSKIDEIKASDSSTVKKVMDLQQTMLDANKNIDSTMPDSNANTHIMEFGKTEMTDAIKGVLADETFNSLPEETKTDFIEAFKGANTVASVGQVLNAIANTIGSDSISNITANYKTSIENRADYLYNSVASDISYKTSLDATAKELDRQKAKQTKVATDAAPKTELNIPYEKLISMNKKELFNTLKEYDTATLNALQKQAKSKKTEARSTEFVSNKLSDNAVINTIKSLLKRTPGVKEASIVQDTIQKIKGARRVSSKIYDPAIPLMQRFKTFISDGLNDIKKETKDTIKDTPTETKVGRLRTIVEAVNDLTKVPSKDIPTIEEVIAYMHKAGSITKANYEKLQSKIDTFVEEKAIKDIDIKKEASDIATNISKMSKGAIDYSKTATKADVERATTNIINKIIKDVKGKMTGSELKLLGFTIAKLEAAGKLSKVKASELLAKLPKNEDGEALSIQDIASQVKEKLTNESVNREYYYTKVSDAVDSVKQTVKDTKLDKTTEEVVKDIKVGATFIKDSLTNVGKSLRGKLDKLSEINTLEWYNSIKEFAKDKDANIKHESVDKVIIDGEVIIDCNS